MSKHLLAFVVAMILGTLIVASPLAAVHVEASPNDAACWGQATKVFAKTGEMGKHASQQENPRLGLRNLARMLYELGEIEADTLQALGAYVSENVDACL